MDERHAYAMIERLQKILEHLQEVEDNLEVTNEPIVTVDNQGRHVFKDVDEMAEYYTRRLER